MESLRRGEALLSWSINDFPAGLNFACLSLLDEFSLQCFSCSGSPIYSWYQTVTCGFYHTMCASDTLTSHFSTVCANAYVCKGPCTNTAWNYSLTLSFSCLSFWRKNNTNLWSSATNILLKQTEIVLSSSHTKRKTHIQHHIEEVLVCVCKFVWFSSYISWPSECHNVSLLPEPSKGVLFWQRETWSLS